MLDLVGTSVLVWLKEKDGRRLLGTFEPLSKFLKGGYIRDHI